MPRKRLSESDLKEFSLHVAAAGALLDKVIARQMHLDAATFCFWKKRSLTQGFLRLSINPQKFEIEELCEFSRTLMAEDVGKRLLKKLEEAGASTLREVIVLAPPARQSTEDEKLQVFARLAAPLLLRRLSGVCGIAYGSTMRALASEMALIAAPLCGLGSRIAAFVPVRGEAIASSSKDSASTLAKILNSAVSASPLKSPPSLDGIPAVIPGEANKEARWNGSNASPMFHGMRGFSAVLAQRHRSFLR